MMLFFLQRCVLKNGAVFFLQRVLKKHGAVFFTEVCFKNVAVFYGGFKKIMVLFPIDTYTIRGHVIQ